MSTLFQEAAIRMENILRVLMRQSNMIPFVVDDSLQIIIGDNQRHLLRLPEVLNHTRNVFMSPNKPLFSTGERNDETMYLVTKGTVYMEHAAAGKEPCVLHQLKPGDFFGYSHLATCPSRLYTAVARKEPAQVIAVDNRLLDKIQRLDMELAYALFQAILVKVVILNDTLFHVAKPFTSQTGSEQADQAIKAAFAEYVGMAPVDSPDKAAPVPAPGTEAAGPGGTEPAVQA